MNQTVLHALARYNAYANKALLETTAKLGLEELSTAPSPSRKSVLNLLHHLLATEAHFLAQCQGRAFQFEPQSVTTIEQLSAFAERHAYDLLAFVSSLDDIAFAREIDVEIGKHTFRFLVWQVFVQVFMHSAQHRGELSILLSTLGHPLPTDDIIVQFAEQRGQTWPWKIKERG